MSLIDKDFLEQVFHSNWQQIEGGKQLFAWQWIGVKFKENFSQKLLKFFSKIDLLVPFLEVETTNIIPLKVLEKSGHLDNFVFKKYSCCGLLWFEKDPDSLQKILVHRAHSNFKELIENNFFKLDQTRALRPETSQGVYFNSKIYQRYLRQYSKWCIWSKGKSYRQERTSRASIVRSNQFEQLEFQFFDTADDSFLDFVLNPGATIKLPLAIYKYIKILEKLFNKIALPFRFLEIKSQELPHYSLQTIDIEILIDNSWIEISSISNRGRYDIKNWLRSNRDLKIYQISLGIDRLTALFFRHLDQLPVFLRPYRRLILVENKRNLRKDLLKNIFNPLEDLLVFCKDYTKKIRTYSKIVRRVYCQTKDGGFKKKFSKATRIKNNSKG